MTAAEIAATAARLVVEEGLEYAAAKRRAARSLGCARGELPSNDLVEDEVRQYLALFRADSQPAELAALRRLALHWMQRLAEFRPHLGGAAWRGTATRLSTLHLDLYCDDPKMAEVALINLGLPYDSAQAPGARGGEPVSVLTISARSPDLRAEVPLHLHVRDWGEVRGALKADAQGRSWRGDAAALERRLAEDGT